VFFGVIPIVVLLIVVMQSPEIFVLFKNTGR
jgi:hypothetical protein